VFYLVMSDEELFQTPSCVKYQPSSLFESIAFSSQFNSTVPEPQTMPVQVSLQTKLAGLSLESCISNASGPLCTNLEELKELANSQSGAIVTKSCTKYLRKGNPGKRYYETENASINSTGLANLGYDFYGPISTSIKKMSLHKPYIVSVAGLRLEDNLHIIEYFQDNYACQGVDAIEINLSCPNIEGKSQVAYDPDATELYLRKIYDLPNTRKLPMGIKLSPYFDHQHFVNQAEIIKNFPVRFVTCINSIGHGLFIDWKTESTYIHPNEGHGGVGGPIILPIALANVRKFRQLLPDSIDIVGCGGVRDGKDVFCHILAGASVVQVGTQFMKEGTNIFRRLNEELTTIMSDKKYSNIQEFKGKLKCL